jgi:hypothetical protein
MGQPREGGRTIGLNRDRSWRLLGGPPGKMDAIVFTEQAKLRGIRGY